MRYSRVDYNFQHKKRNRKKIKFKKVLSVWHLLPLLTTTAIGINLNVIRIDRLTISPDTCHIHNIQKKQIFNVCLVCKNDSAGSETDCHMCILHMVGGGTQQIAEWTISRFFVVMRNQPKWFAYAIYMTIFSASMRLFAIRDK